MYTILIIDKDKPHLSTRALEGLGYLLIVVDDVQRARFVLRNIPLDMWICDLSIDDLNFTRLRAEAMILNSEARVLLTGPTLSQVHGNTLIGRGLADRFIAKPWPSTFAGTVRLLAQDKHGRQSKREAEGQAGEAENPAKAVGAPKKIIVMPRKPQYRLKPSAAEVAEAEAITSDSRYRLDELLGEGGMGRVYRARDTLLDMEVAVKLLSHEFSRDEEAIATLKEETRLCLQLLHKHIVRIYNLEHRRDMFLIIMEYVKGQSLGNYMAAAPEGLPIDFILQVVTIMGDALGYAHRQGILHKDITPGNVLISDDGILKIIDFGIAGHLNRQNITSEYVIGTPVYMSPEQLRGEDLDVRSDIYSLGVLTYQMLTGLLPQSPDASFEELAYQPHPEPEGLRSDVAEVLEIATAFDRERRWRSVADFARVLSETIGEKVS